MTFRPGLTWVVSGFIFSNLLNAVKISPRKFTLANIFMGALCVSHRESDDIGSQPFALVGHGFGGLVIKALVNEARRCSVRAERNALDRSAISKAKTFLKNLKLVVFYAVPHSGADVETLTDYVNYCSGRARLCLPENLNSFSRKMAKMSVMMEDAFKKKKINIYAFGEGQPTYEGKMVVEPASAMQLAGNYFYNLEDCNHTEVCKPVDKQHPSYSILVDHLRTSREGTEPEPQEQREAIKAQLATNLEIVEKMDDFKTSQQIPIEGEVSRRMQEINLFTNLEASVANSKVSLYKAKPMSTF
jgi:hypothetical protein